MESEKGRDNPTEAKRSSKRYEGFSQVHDIQCSLLFMPHLSSLYRFLTVLCAVFGFGRIFFAVLDDFFLPVPPSLYYSGIILASYNYSNDPNDEAKYSSAESLTYHGKEQFSLSFSYSLTSLNNGTFEYNA